MSNASRDDGASRTASGSATPIVITQLVGEEDSEEDRGDSEVTASDESEDIGIPGLTITLDGPNPTVGDVLRTTTRELNRMFDDVSLRFRGRPALSQNQLKEERARLLKLRAQTGLGPLRVQAPAASRALSTPPQDDVSPHVWPAGPRHDGEHSRPVRAPRRTSPRRGRERAVIRGSPAPPQDDVRHDDGGDGTPEQDGDEPAVTWYGALVTLTTLGLGTWKLAAAYANEAAVAVNAVDWVLSVVLALLFFWLDRLCRRVRWLRWMKQRSVPADISAATRRACGPFGRVYAWLKSDMRPPDEERQ
ncbi:hypothetical protein PsYK624_063480 [Phanerochaete sordida]|uniref:Uncharacterized protein n=1 Tax=Phanerochaete sordida TaxID=48140 RepID=A0A9P3LC76_9APHY|nr:hypothetical protein PsYK624_063480 [Phanerochaete sordida]